MKCLEYYAAPFWRRLFASPTHNHRVLSLAGIKEATVADLDARIDPVSITRTLVYCICRDCKTEHIERSAFTLDVASQVYKVDKE